MDYKILTQEDLLDIFPFGKSKLNQLLRSGRDYLINEKELDRWFEKNKGKEVFY